MIITNVGTPGSGKTYDAVRTILANLKRRRRVYTNIDGLDNPVNRRFIQDALNEWASKNNKDQFDDYEFNKLLVWLSKDEVNRFWEICKDGSIIVLDEVHKNFSNREWSSEKNKVFADWASTHRHHGFDVILITQDIEKVEKHVRSLIEWSYYFRKINFLGSAVKQKYIKYSYAGDDHNGNPLSKNICTYDPFIFQCYQSYAASDVQELGFMSHLNVLKHPVFFLIPAVFVFGCYVFSKSSFASGDLFGTSSREKRIAKLQARGPAHKAVSPPAPALPVPGLPAAPVSVPRSLPLPPPPLPVLKPLSSASGHHLEASAEPAPASSSHSMTGYVWKDKHGQFHLTNMRDTIPSGARLTVYHF